MPPTNRPASEGLPDVKGWARVRKALQRDEVLDDVGVLHVETSCRISCRGARVGSMTGSMMSRSSRRALEDLEDLDVWRSKDELRRELKKGIKRGVLLALPARLKPIPTPTPTLLLPYPYPYPNPNPTPTPTHPYPYP